MSKETAKCREIREGRNDFDRYLHGFGIDIGCGPDLLKIKNGTVRPWDLADGDAMLLAGVADQSYDFSYSSHCLEHLPDVKLGLKNWVRILRPGGILYFVVPDYELYEDQVWPSRFNPDHKASFSLQTRAAEHPHYYMLDLVEYLMTLNCALLELRLEDYAYDYLVKLDQTEGAACAQICYIGRKIS